MAEIHEQNCLKAIEINDYTTFLLNINLLEFNTPTHPKMNLFKAFKILALIKLNEIEQLNCFLITLSYEEWCLPEIQLAYTIFDLFETWSLNGLVNVLKTCQFREFKSVLSEIIEEIKHKTSNIQIEDEEDRRIVESLKRIKELIGLKAKICFNE
ncbi:hypothetical protein CDIK_0545 [Cucumispora dikerogammari]|nr:hypothetical protein CDIK_0545 [Cucumispora dikerogammari]